MKSPFWNFSQKGVLLLGFGVGGFSQLFYDSTHAKVDALHRDQVELRDLKSEKSLLAHVCDTAICWRHVRRNYSRTTRQTNIVDPIRAHDLGAVEEMLALMA